jgi:DnaJ-domain-containing protein 1
MFQKRRTIDKEYIRNRRKADRQRLVAKTEAETLQLLFSFVAGADGKLSDGEAAEYSSFMAQCSNCDLAGARGVGPGAAVSTSGDLVGQLRRYMSVCRPSLASRRKLLRALNQLALCDGAVNQDEVLALDKVARHLQLTARTESTRELNNRFSAQRDGAAAHADEFASTMGRKASGAVDDRLGGALWCYAVLGCSHHDSDDVVKRAYRRLAALLHPDKYSARAASPEQVRVHQQEFQRLQEAYEEVKRLRATGQQRRGSR